MKVAEAIAKTLVAEGIDTVFSLLGEATMHVVSHLDSLGVKVVDCRHEGAAMAMADGYSRASGKPVLCAVTTGPAFAHTLVPLTSASRTRSQVVVLTGLRSHDDLGDRQRMDHQGIARMAGVSYRPLMDPDNAVERVREAVDLARYEGRPVVLDVAEEIQVQDYPWGVDERPLPAWRKPQRMHPDPAVVEEAVRMLAGAERPVIIAGIGAVHSGARDEIIALAQDTGALLASTLDSKGLFDGDPYNAGIAGLYSSDPVMALFAEADCVVSFGASLNAYTMAKGYLLPSASFIQVDVLSPRPMKSGQDAECYIQGDALATARALRDGLRSAGAADKTGYRTAEIASTLANVEIDPVEIEIGPDELDPRRVCAEVDELLPDTVGFATGLSGHFWSFTALHMTKRRTPVVNGTYVGAIGYGVPVGIGAALADPDRPMVVFEGDGSLMQNIHALETAARHGVRILVVVMNNESLGAELYKMTLKGLNAELSNAPGLDIAGVAAAFGCRSITATSMDQVRSFTREFLEGTGPYVLDARISRKVMSRTFRRSNLGEK
ncbi:MAG TPA: thiamine pyrophosphate-binding protein [Acidimicrobiia bacterium]|nr:thiamine pyrophosphate-binding protein [Acidimicrobiia bacterium]